MRFVRDIIERRILRYVIAYWAVGFASLELIDQLVGNEIAPPVAYRAMLTLVICGFPGALIVSWFHGAKGKQEMPRIEAWLLAGVALFALTTTGFVARVPASAGVAGELAPTEDPRRVAVMYMDSRGGGDAEFLASGLTEALIDQLGGVEGLHVVSRNGSQLFRGVAAPPDSVARTLQVGALVGGTVAVAGDRVRVDIALSRSLTGEQIRSVRLERPRTEIFELQDQLADTVSFLLRRELGRELGERKLRVGTKSTRAWELVSQASHATEMARQLMFEAGSAQATASLLRADSLLAQAETADPTWVEPIIRRAWLTDRRLRLARGDRNEDERWVTRGYEHARRAVAAAPNDPAALEVHATLVLWRYMIGSADNPDEAKRLFFEAEAGFRAAIAAAGGRLASAQNSLSYILLGTDAIEEAKLNALQAYNLDPFLENVHLTLWRIFLASWNLQERVEAERYCEAGGRRFPEDPRFDQCRLMLLALPGSTADIAAAWRTAEAWASKSPPAMAEYNRRAGMMYVSMGLARAGLADSARAVARRGRASSDIDPSRELPKLEAITLALIGDAQEAVRQLSLHLSANPHMIDGLRAEAADRKLPWYFESLQDEPAFRSLVGLR